MKIQREFKPIFRTFPIEKRDKTVLICWSHKLACQKSSPKQTRQADRICFLLSFFGQQAQSGLGGSTPQHSLFISASWSGNGGGDDALNPVVNSGVLRMAGEVNNSSSASATNWRINATSGVTGVNRRRQEPS